MTLTDAKPKQRVRYTPTGEEGIVSSSNWAFVFVRFDREIAAAGSFGKATAKACSAEDLELIEDAPAPSRRSGLAWFEKK